MDLTITEITPEKMQALDALARSKGKSAEEYVRELIEVEILAAKPFDEILTLARQSFNESGMTRGELTAFLEEAHEEDWAEKHGSTRWSFRPR